jgi:hypothetical protein
MASHQFPYPQFQDLCFSGKPPGDNTLSMLNPVDSMQVHSVEKDGSSRDLFLSAILKNPDSPWAIDPDDTPTHRYSLPYLMEKMCNAKAIFEDPNTLLVPKESMVHGSSVSSPVAPNATATSRRRYTVSALSDKMRAKLPSIDELNVMRNLPGSPLSTRNRRQEDGVGEQAGLKEGKKNSPDEKHTTTKDKGQRGIFGSKKVGTPSAANKNRTVHKVEKGGTDVGEKDSTKVQASRMNRKASGVEKHKSSSATVQALDKPSPERPKVSTASGRVWDWNIDELVAAGLSLFAVDGVRELVRDLLERGIQDHRAAYPSAKVTRKIQLELTKKEGRLFGQLTGSEALAMFKAHWKEVRSPFLCAYARN